MSISYEKWIEDYDPIKNHITKDAPFDGMMFETYGEDYDFVKKNIQKFIWTLVDGDGGSYILSGFHVVNRLGYFICENPISEEDFQQGICVDIESEIE